MGHVVDTPSWAAGPTNASPGKNRHSIFIANLLKQKAITQEMADTLYLLPNPPLQFQAMMRFRQQPGKSLSTIVQEMLAVPPEPPRGWKEKHSNLRSGRWINKKLFIRASFWVGIILAVIVFWNKFPMIQTFMQKMKPAKSVRPLPPPVAVAAPAAPAAPDEMALAPYVPAPVLSPHAKPALAPTHLTSAVSPANAPRHLTAKWQAHGMVHVTWESARPESQYRLYTASSEDYRGERILRQDAIPMTWWDWMPPEGPATVWLAVSQILPDGRESPLSRPVQINIP